MSSSYNLRDHRDQVNLIHAKQVLTFDYRSIQVFFVSSFMKRTVLGESTVICLPPKLEK